jgi:hypothetical protein
MTAKYKCLYDITGKIEDVNTFLVPLQDLAKQAQGEPCPDKEHTEYACKNRHQCFEPCGELGHDEEFVQVYKQEQGEPASVTYKEVADTMNALWGGTVEQVQMAQALENKKLHISPQQRKPLDCFETEKLAKQCGIEWTTRIDKLCKLAAAHGIKE